MIDTLETVHALRASGMEEKQAEAIAKVVSSAVGQSRSDLSTRADLSQTASTLEHRIDASRIDLERQIGELRTEVRVGLANTAAGLSDVVAKMEAIRSSLIMWMIGLVIAVAGITFTIARFVHPG